MRIHGFLKMREVTAQAEEPNPIYMSGLKDMDSLVHQIIIFNRFINDANDPFLSGLLFLIMCLIP